MPKIQKLTYNYLNKHLVHLFPQLLVPLQYMVLPEYILLQQEVCNDNEDKVIYWIQPKVLQKVSITRKSSFFLLLCSLLDLLSHVQNLLEVPKKYEKLLKIDFKLRYLFILAVNSKEP